MIAEFLLRNNDKHLAHGSEQELDSIGPPHDERPFI
jgi:hypothetical protein